MLQLQENILRRILRSHLVPTCWDSKPVVGQFDAANTQIACLKHSSHLINPARKNAHTCVLSPFAETYGNEATKYNSDSCANKNWGVNFRSTSLFYRLETLRDRHRVGESMEVLINLLCKPRIVRFAHIHHWLTKRRTRRLTQLSRCHSTSNVWSK